MSTVTVKWLEGGQFIGVDSTNHSVVLSSTHEGIGIKPSDLLPIAAAACVAVDVVGILAKKRMPLTYLEIKTTSDQDQDPPWTFRSLHMHFRLAGVNLTDKAVTQAISLSEEKYCSVAATIRATVHITSGFEIIDNPLTSSTSN